MNIRIEKHEYDKNFDDSWCVGCLEEFDGMEDCIKFVSLSGYDTFMCLDCFERYKNKINEVQF